MKKIYIKDPPIQDWEINNYTDNPDLPNPKDLVKVKKGLPPKSKELVSKASRKYIKKGKIFEGTFGRMQLVEDFLPSPQALKNARVRVYLKGKIHSEYVLHDGKRGNK